MARIQGEQGISGGISRLYLLSKPQRWREGFHESVYILLFSVFFLGPMSPFFKLSFSPQTHNPPREDKIRKPASHDRRTHKKDWNIVPRERAEFRSTTGYLDIGDTQLSLLGDTQFGMTDYAFFFWEAAFPIFPFFLTFLLSLLREGPLLVS